MRTQHERSNHPKLIALHLRHCLLSLLSLIAEMMQMHHALPVTVSGHEGMHV